MRQSLEIWVVQNCAELAEGFRHGWEAGDLEIGDSRRAGLRNEANWRDWTESEGFVVTSLHCSETRVMNVSLSPLTGGIVAVNLRLISLGSKIAYLIYL